MFQILCVLLSGPAFAQDAEAEPTSDDLADIPETEAEMNEVAAEAEAAPALSPEQVARMATIEARLTELGTCDIKRKRKAEACRTEKNALELELTELTPVTADDSATRDMDAAEDTMADGADAGMAADEAPGEEDSLELDVGDE